MYSSCALFSPVFCEVPFRSFQVVSKTRRKFETGLLYSIILIMTSIEVVIGNCLQVYVAQLWKYGASRIIESRLTFWGHVTLSITWPFNSRWSTSFWWSIVTMPLSSTVMDIRLFGVPPGRLFQEQRSVVGPQYYTDLIYSSSLR